MKALIVLMLVATFLCGCNKTSTQAPVQKWEYKVIAVENFEHYMEETSFTNHIDLGQIRAAKSGAGDFNLDISPDAIKSWNTKYALDIYSLGQQGWELVSAIPQIETIPDAETGEKWDPEKSDFTSYREFSNVRTGKIILFFKRPAR